ncbi:MAG TPA: hypothetical protein VIC26_09690 [Marinagarivorans sp.]
MLGYETIGDAVADINNYIDYYYNCTRPHTANNDLLPMQAEQSAMHEAIMYEAIKVN